MTIRTPARPVACFLVGAYAISWGWTLPLMATGEVVKAGVGWPTIMPALAGPLLAAAAVTALAGGRVGLRDLLAGVTRWRMTLGWWVAALSPLAFLGAALLVASFTHQLPRWSDFGRYSGVPTMGVAAVLVVAVLSTFGEEVGWRGFALPRLQDRFGALIASLLVTAMWALWHLPFFFTVATYRGLPAAGYAGFVFGLACGSVVLTWLYNGTGGSVIACALWHGLYNVATGTAAANATIQAATSGFVYALAILLVVLEVRARRRGAPSVLGPPPTGRSTP
ncbi:MAG: hypothetical protein JWP61_2288 [Friedmanniella sp.]|nr:hypothetical protein [Friedmanniella sp.]